MQYLTIVYQKKTKSNNQRYKRNRGPDNISKLRNDLLKEEWKDVYTSDVNIAYESFLNCYLSLYNKHCPNVPYKPVKRNIEKPWLTNGLKNACKKKNKLYKVFIKSRTENAEKRYKSYKNKLINKLRQAKKEYYNRILHENKNNIKATWKILNKVIGNKTETTELPNYFFKNDLVIENEAEMVNELNNFFVNIGPNLANEITVNSSQGRHWENRVMHSMFLAEVTEYDILSVVHKLKNKTSTDSDGIDMKIIKMTIDCIIKPFLYIVNLSFKTGVFPDKMKMAKVIPFFKTGDKHNFNNYRPISLLSQFSKVLEKLFVNKLDNFIETNQ